MPTPKQMDKLAAEAARRAATPPEPHPGPADPLPEAYWASVLAEPQHRARGVPIQQRRLAEIPRHLLRVWCRRCDRTVEIQRAARRARLAREADATASPAER